MNSYINFDGRIRLMFVFQKEKIGMRNQVWMSVIPKLVGCGIEKLMKRIRN